MSLPDTLEVRLRFRRVFDASDRVIYVLDAVWPFKVDPPIAAFTLAPGEVLGESTVAEFEAKLNQQVLEALAERVKKR